MYMCISVPGATPALGLLSYARRAGSQEPNCELLRTCTLASPKFCKTQGRVNSSEDSFPGN